MGSNKEQIFATAFSKEKCC